MSNIGTIIEMVQHKLAFAEGLESEDKISQFRNQAFYLMQCQTGKSDSDVENEDSYRPIERMMFADYVAYEMLKARIIKFSAGTGNKAGTGQKVLKKAKADVVESEFMYDDSFIMKAKEIMAECKESACTKARAAGYTFYFCNEIEYDPCPPFRTVRDC